MFLKTRQQLFWIQAKTGAADPVSVSLRFCYLLPLGFGYFRPSLCCTSLWNHTVDQIHSPPRIQNCLLKKYLQFIQKKDKNIPVIFQYAIPSVSTQYPSKGHFFAQLWFIVAVRWPVSHTSPGCSYRPFRKSSWECAACWLFVRPWWLWNSFCCFQLSCSVSVIFF